MNNSEPGISSETATEVFTLAARLQAARKKHDYSLAELMQAGAEAHISPELIQQALQLLEQTQAQARWRQQKRKLIVISGSVGAAIALLSLWVYNTLAGHFTPARRESVTYLGENPHRQSRPPQPSVPPESTITTLTGEVQQYLLNPEGKVDGLLLNNGLQVKFGPHMADSLVAMVAPGEKISVSGTPGISTHFGQEVKAESITNSKTGRTLVEHPPTYAPHPPILGNYNTLSFEGTAQHWLVGHRGEINGVILSQGVQVKFPPHVGMQLSTWIKVGDKVQVQGFGISNPYGSVLEATALTVNGQPVSFNPKEPKGPPMQP